jgi:hypothetical protein
MALTTRLRTSVNAQQTATRDTGVASDPISLAFSVSLDDGTGAGQANRIFADTRTLAASTPEDLDLAAGALTDAYGNVLTFARIKGLVVSAAAGNTNNVVVGNATSNTWVGPFGAAAHTVAVRPGETKTIVACGEDDAVGYPVTAGTGDILKVLNGGGTTSVTYTIVIVGTSA